MSLSPPPRRIVLFLLLVAIVSGCGGTSCSNTSKVIRIGAVLPLSGDGAVYGQRTRKGMDLAVEEINASGGIDGKRLEIIYEDDRMEPKDGVSALRKLVSANQVPAVIGCVSSGVVLAMAPVANETKTVLLSPYASNFKITDAGDYVFRIYPSDTSQGVLDAKLAKDIGCRKVAILYINSDYGVGLKNVFTEHFTRDGGEVVLSEAFQEEDTNFRAQLTKIKSSDATCVFMPGNAKEMARILIQAKQLEVEQRFIATDSFLAENIIKDAGAAAEGVVFTTLAENRDEVYGKFAAQYRSKHNEDPGLLEGLGYDSVNVLALAIQRGGRTGPEIKTALYKIHDFSGATGPVSFDDNGDVSKQFKVQIVRDGAFQDFTNSQ